MMAHSNYTTESNFVFYASFMDALELLPDEEQLQVYRAIARYGCRREEALARKLAAFKQSLQSSS